MPPHILSRCGRNNTHNDSYQKIFKIDTNAEIAEIEHDEKSSMLAPHIVSLRVTNRMVDGLSMKKLHTLISCDYVISRIEKPDGTVIIPKSEDVINYDDALSCGFVLRKMRRCLPDLYSPVIEKTWEREKYPCSIASHSCNQDRVYNGTKLGSMRLHSAYNLNVTRVNRAGVDLVAGPNLRLQMGDRLTVVGKLDDINNLANRLGNSMKRLNEPNLITMFIGIFLGILVGSIPLQFPRVCQFR